MLFDSKRKALRSCGLDTLEPKSGSGGVKASKHEENIITNKTLVRNDSPFILSSL